MPRTRSPKADKGFKQLLEENPLVVVLGAAVAVGSAVAGVMTYLETQHVNVLTA